MKLDPFNIFTNQWMTLYLKLSFKRISSNIWNELKLAYSALHDFDFH